MEVESKYIVRRPGAFSAALVAQALGQYRLEPMDSVHVHDSYADTDGADLLNQGYALRIRRQGEAALVSLKSIARADGPLHRRIELEARLEGAFEVNGHLDIPDGLLKDRVGALIGIRPLVPLLQLRQYRSPRIVFDGNRLVGVLSLDVIAHETAVGPDISHQLEVELAGDGREVDIYRLDPILKERGMEPAAMSKFERGLILLQRDPANALLLLPDERAALSRFSEAGTPLYRRRTRVILLFARGLDSAAVANKVGLSHLRVEHWLAAFRRERMDIFDDATTDHHDLLGHGRGDRYAILDLVLSGPALPSLFPAGAVREAVGKSVLRDSLHRDHAPSPALDLQRRLNESGGGFGEGAAEIVREESEESERRAPDQERAMSAGDGFGSPLPIVAESIPSDQFGPSRISTRTAVFSDRGHGVTAEALAAAEVAKSRPAPKLGARQAHRGAIKPGPAADEQMVIPENESVAPNGEDICAASITSRARPVPNRPVLRSEASVLSAAERVLRYQFAWHADAIDRVEASGGEPRSIRRFLVAVHRLRIALQLFEDYLPPRPVHRVHQGLHAMVRTLETLNDLDHVIAHVASAQREAPGDSAADLRLVVDDLHRQRDSAWNAVQARLGGAAHAQSGRRFGRLLERLASQANEGVEVDEFTPAEPEDYLIHSDAPPRRTRLRHMLGSAIWRRYEGLRAFDATADEASDDRLHPLGVACAAMQYVLALTSGCADESLRDVSRPMARLESHLAVLHHARLTADVLDAYAGLGAAARLRDHLRVIQSEVIAEIAELTGALLHVEYRQSLARVIASL